jgi:flavin-dependent dehydrogenase
MRLKGSHLAMKSGMLAADALYDHLCGDKPYDYEERIRGSWIYQELHRARNIRPGFSTGNLKGLWAGLMKAGLINIYLTVMPRGPFIRIRQIMKTLNPSISILLLNTQNRTVS